MDYGYKREDTGGRILFERTWREDAKHWKKDIKVKILEAGYQLFRAYWKGGYFMVENGYKSEETGGRILVRRFWEEVTIHNG